MVDLTITISMIAQLQAYFIGLISEAHTKGPQYIEMPYFVHLSVFADSIYRHLTQFILCKLKYSHTFTTCPEMFSYCWKKSLPEVKWILIPCTNFTHFPHTSIGITICRSDYVDNDCIWPEHRRLRFWIHSGIFRNCQNASILSIIWILFRCAERYMKLTV